jgi:hypothetical protein
MPPVEFEPTIAGGDNRSSRAAADLRRRPRGHWDRQNCTHEILTLQRYLNCVHKTAFLVIN